VLAPDIRDQFPFLTRRINGKPVIYLDNAATTQKPRAVIDRLTQLYSSGLANVHRAMSLLAEEVTEEYERARRSVAFFLNADPSEIVFTPNATFGLNLVCSSLARRGPLRVLSTTLEHHSNFLPWGPGAPAGVTTQFVRWSPERIDLDDLKARLASGVDLVAVASAGNFLGNLQPVAEIARLTRAAGAQLLVDASQSVAHTQTDVQALDCDYLVFSGHKVYAPGGTGVLFVRGDRAATFEPVFVGGSMVREVRTDGYTLNDVPLRFEAGTPNIDGVIGLAAALDWLSGLDLHAVEAHEASLTAHAKQSLASIPGVRLLGPPSGQPSAPLVSFLVEGLESHAITKNLSLRSNVILRSGFHCAQPAHAELSLGPTVRASFALYNTLEEIDEAVRVIGSLAAALR
jgi:cysteine desulfurase/selenocysteine lyase